MRTLLATDEELLALRQLLHRAVLHSGMEAAEAAAHWNKKIVDVMADPAIKGNGKIKEAVTTAN